MELIFPYMTEWLLIATLMLMAVASPGPDFVIAVRHSILYSRKTGFFTALGFGAGVCVHITYCMIGISALIASSVTAFTIIKYIGAGFLIYMGIKALQSKGFTGNASTRGEQKKPDISSIQALKIGFLTNLLNPKATMFFLALFTQVIDQTTPVAIQLLYGGTCVLIVTLWFCVVTFVLSNRHVKNSFLGFATWIDRICGGLMIALGVRLALAKL